MVQPAIPASAATSDPDHYGGLTGPSVGELTVTINNGDSALFWYELGGGAALGDEAADGWGLNQLVDRRDAAGLATDVVDHDSSAGSGHLGVSPNGSQGLVRSLTQELVDRGATGEPSPQTDVRTWLYAEHGDVADEVIASQELRTYLDAQQEAGEPPSRAEVARIVEELRPTPVAPTGTTTPAPVPAPVPELRVPTSAVPMPTPGPAPSPPTGTTIPVG